MSIVERVRRRVSPLHQVITYPDWRRVKGLAAAAPGTAAVAGHPVAFSAREGFVHSVREIFLDDVYKFRAKTATPYIVDAGANIGLSVLYFKRLYPQATVVAYEPDVAIFALLERNLGGMPGVELHRAAAWVEDTELTFYSEGSLAGSSEMDFAGQGVAVTVKAERLRDALDRPVDFLKIDIEGAENKVLFDIEPQLGNVDHLFFEYHSVPGQPQLLGELLDLVKRAGYRYIINGPHGPRLPFVERVPYGFDLQLNVSCFRD